MPRRWTRNEIPNLNGKVVIVTGANSGIGYEVAKILASKKAIVILACRNNVKATKALEKIQKKAPNLQANYIQLDLASIVSIKAFASEFNRKYNRLDILVNNAGILRVPYQETKDGFESQVGVNHLGHFALTSLLFKKLTETKGSRVVNVSSNAHKSADMDFDKFVFEEGKEYFKEKAYGRSKLANLLFTYELDRRLKKAKIDVIAVASHPGFSNTAMADHLFGGIVYPLRKTLGFLIQSAAKGALPTIRAAVDPNVKSGEYHGIKGLFGNEQVGKPVITESSKASYDLEIAMKLWDISEKLTGIKFVIK
jgi:NAD(P)-dependent dehydrogenase (short-subunit alcohol dehydrogenase family)